MFIIWAVMLRYPRKTRPAEPRFTKLQVALIQVKTGHTCKNFLLLLFNVLH